ncbi:MAG: hypothetical protein WA628_21080 [Terriglobales bacterium]
MGSSTRTFAVLGGVVLIVIALAGWGLRTLLARPKPQVEAMQPYMPQGQSQMGMPNVANLANLAGMGGDQAVMLQLMTRYRMDPRAASYLSQTKIKVIDENDTSVHYVLTFPDGVTSDETVTIKPDQHYTPTDAELQRVSRSQLKVFHPELTQKKVSEDEVQFTLRYYVQQDTLPASVLERIRKSKASARRTDFFSIVPAAWAQQGGGDNGAGFVGWNVAELVKSMGVKGLEHAEWEKAAKGLDNILTLKDLIVGYGEISEWLGEVQELEDCAKHPTNPLTAKAAQSQEYQQQVIGGLNEASWDVQMTAFPKVANIAAGAVTQFLPFGTGVLISPITSANDQAIAQIAEEQIADAKKMVVPCDKESEMTAFGFRPMTGKFDYKYVEEHKNCNENGCNHNKTVREAKGTFELDPDATEASVAKNVGSGFIQEDGGFENTKCHGETHTSLKGPVRVMAEVGGLPEAAIVELNIGGDMWEGKTDSWQNCGAMPPVHDTWNNGGFGLTCKVKNINMVTGGSGTDFVEADRGHGTCTIELQRK